MLAQHLGIQVRDELAPRGYRHLTLLELEVEENYGQSRHLPRGVRAD